MLKPPEWAVAFADDLDRNEIDHLMNEWNEKPRPEKIASDCTGANAQWFAAKALFAALGLIGIFISFDHVFGSEDPKCKGDAPRLWNKLNCMTRVMYNDITQRSRQGIDRWSGQVRRLPNVIGQYSSGWVCHDIARTNTMHKKEVKERSDADGAGPRKLLTK